MTSSAVRSAVSLRTLSGVPDVLALYERLREDGYPWLLDSALRCERLGRYSFLGADPYLVMRAFGKRIELDLRRDVRPDLSAGQEALAGDPFEVARSLMPPAPPAFEGPPFCGGAVGYWGYELGEHTEPVALQARDELGLPDLVLCFVDRLVAIDHVAARSWAVGVGFGASHEEARLRARAASEEVALRAASVPCASGTQARACATPRPGDAAETVLPEEGDVPGQALRPDARVSLEAELPREVRPGLDAGAYARAVLEIQRDIQQGNVYQANLTQRMERPYDGDALQLYRALRRLNPAPFSALLELPEVAIVSSSPERYLRVDAGGGVESRPIKGTRPRGRTRQADACLAAALAHSEKDRAENLMIVDLVRNDLGRVCETGSVEVPELMAIEAYASVFQMVSTVTGRLAAGRDVTDLMRATFPPGSMTGAPKIAAMRIIDRHEPVRRGIYSGALGYLDLRGGADLSVVIRTLLLKEGTAFLHAGGAVVADSDPQGEHRECLDKARALVAALTAAEAPGTFW